jgi:hypothetical protein
MLRRAHLSQMLRGRSRIFAAVVGVLFLHALVQPELFIRPADPPAGHVAIDNCDGGPTGCKVLPFAQFVAQTPGPDRRMEPPPPFAFSVSSDTESRYEAPLQPIERPPRTSLA